MQDFHRVHQVSQSNDILNVVFLDTMLSVVFIHVCPTPEFFPPSVKRVKLQSAERAPHGMSFKLKICCDFGITPRRCGDLRLSVRFNSDFLP